MPKKTGLLVMLVFAAVFLQSSLREAVSLDTLREAGIPVEEMEEAGISVEDMKLYLVFWEDIRYFPVAVQSGEKTFPFSYTDTWMEERTFGGDRKHEGCDIFGEIRTPGYYPVVSITDGTVEKVGWLPLGGWRIGVRSSGGGYFYYAHLSSYEKVFQEGDFVRAGEILGFLGDTGYGEEGTRGKFLSHLHMGLYVKARGQEEYALNPFPMLRCLQEFTKELAY